jgi:hypothetical protein
VKELKLRLTVILIVLGMNVILWKILVKVMFAKNLAGQNFLPWPPCRAALPCDSLCFVVSFYKKALRKSQKQLRICRFSMNMTLIDRLQLQTFDIIFVELNQSLIHITV